ncbi:hypothetical protein PVAP13_8KG150001 [Panicum virgatum]|uniref:Uncharacterized protein n=1 Tax=Panicum virgatum TaxID=38727 RepID=A0A8T0PGL5_PANVG|nr:hypothetical protein PVAP13_8KG150001 [Panicum virgatum]
MVTPQQRKSSASMFGWGPTGPCGCIASHGDLRVFYPEWTKYEETKSQVNDDMPGRLVQTTKYKLCLITSSTDKKKGLCEGDKDSKGQGASQVNCHSKHLSKRHPPLRGPCRGDGDGQLPLARSGGARMTHVEPLKPPRLFRLVRTAASLGPPGQQHASIAPRPSNSSCRLTESEHRSVSGGTSSC